MSGTRLHFPPAPAINDRLVIVAHGERGGAADNRALHGLAFSVEQRLGLSVLAATLFGEPNLDHVLSGATPSRTWIYPMFLSDGYYVRSVVPTRLAAYSNAAGFGGDGWRVLSPLGLDAGLPGLVHRSIEAKMDSRGWSEQETTVLLVGHGSAISAQPRNAIRRIAFSLENASEFAGIRVAFLEEAPTIEAVARRLPQKTVVVGLFSGCGQHASTDVPTLLRPYHHEWPVIPSIGGEPAIAALIADAFRVGHASANPNYASANAAPVRQTATTDAFVASHG